MKARRLVGRAVSALALLLPGVARAEAPAASPRPERAVDLGVVAVANRASFATLPVTRFGAMLEIRGRRLPVSGTVLLEGGTTENGLGAHRVEVGLDARTPWPYVSLRAGPHVGYAMLVRATGSNAFVRALTGDIGTVAIGVHAAVEIFLPVRGATGVTLGFRAMTERYDGAAGHALGPQLGVVF